ncbi:hypothetical protein F4779DRAFT_622991 [Xylariaceae sp. FL0662B]|nr:hypothetical protein F4779DRAFT_622991 [Xylariaceae sp. FL0662B]
MGVSASIPANPSQKIEVIGAGFSRTGSAALALALEQLLDGPVMHGGSQMVHREDAYMRKMVHLYQCRHDKAIVMKLLKEITTGFAGITDAPGILFVPELLELYPNAKVVLQTRNPDEWWESMKSVAKNVKLEWLRFLLFPVPGRRWIPDMMMGSLAKSQDIYGPVRPGGYILKAHDDYIRRVVPKDKLLVMELKEGWAPLCKFLNKPIPTCPFPRSNESKAVEELAKQISGKAMMTWLMILALVSLSICTGLDNWEALKCTTLLAVINNSRRGNALPTPYSIGPDRSFSQLSPNSSPSPISAVSADVSLDTSSGNILPSPYFCDSKRQRLPLQEMNIPWDLDGGNDYTIENLRHCYQTPPMSYSVRVMGDDGFLLLIAEDGSVVWSYHSDLNDGNGDEWDRVKEEKIGQTAALRAPRACHNVVLWTSDAPAVDISSIADGTY